jgi:hypothetical protein
MNEAMTFAELLKGANESKTGRNPGQWTPAAVVAWRAASHQRWPDCSMPLLPWS